MSLSPLLLQLFLFPGNVRKQTFDNITRAVYSLVCGKVKPNYGLSTSEKLFISAPACQKSRFLAFSCPCLLQIINLKLGWTRNTEQVRITQISRATKMNTTSKSLQSCVVLNRACYAANVLATFWPNPGPIACCAEPQPWSLRMSPHLAPRRRWRRDTVEVKVQLVLRLLIALPLRQLFHAAFSPSWKSTCDVIRSRQRVLLATNI